MRTKRSDGMQCHYEVSLWNEELSCRDRKKQRAAGKKAVCSLKADALFRKSAAQQITQTVILPVHALYAVF